MQTNPVIVNTTRVTFIACYSLTPWPSVLVTSLRGWDPGWTSALCDRDLRRFVPAAVGYGVLRISSNVSSLMGGGYWAESSSCDVFNMSLDLGGRIPSTRFVGAGAAVMRRISSLVDAVGVLWFGLDLHGASNKPGP